MTPDDRYPPEVLEVWRALLRLEPRDAAATAQSFVRSRDRYMNEAEAHAAERNIGAASRCAAVSKVSQTLVLLAVAARDRRVATEQDLAATLAGWVMPEDLEGGRPMAVQLDDDEDDEGGCDPSESDGGEL